MARSSTSKAPLSLAAVGIIATVAMVTLAALVWIALSFNHSGLIAALLPLIPLLYTLFTDLVRKAIEAREADAEEIKSSDKTSPAKDE